MVVVLDSNIWISLALNQQLDFISSLNKNGIIIATCKNLLDELIIVLSTPKFQKHFTTNFLEKFIQFHQLTTNIFELSDIETVVTDKKDNYLFALCKVANADYFITGDKLLTAVNKYHNTSVITLTGFKNILNPA
jgi:putative PIN family toxin of toxin-antitoxin system